MPVTLDRRMRRIVCGWTASGVLAAALAASGATAAFSAPATGPAGIIRDLQILSTAPAFGGATPPGAAGPYEIVTAVAHGALDPRAAANAGVADLSLAPRAADGLVDYSTDVVILRPVHAADARRLLVYEVVNRGRKLGIPVFVGADPARAAPPPANFPSLLATGATLVWSGWQGDLPQTGAPAIAGAAPIGTRFPIAKAADGKPIIGFSREEFIPDYAGGAPDRVPLSYAPADPADRASVTFTARQSWLTGYGRAAEGHPDYRAPSVAVTDWRYVAGKDGAAEVAFTPPSSVPGPDGAQVPADGGTIYSFVYRAKDPRVDGVGFAAVRDLVAFLRSGRKDAAGHPNPLADLAAAPCIRAACPAHPEGNFDLAVGVGISQSGRFLRDFLYQGFNNADGRPVFDAMMPIIAGARRTWVNARFAQPGRWSKEHEDHWQPGDQFPFAYAVQRDPAGGRADGLMRACEATHTCPKIMQLDGSFEWWGARASLVVTNGKGRDIALPPNVRYYLIPGTRHGGGSGIGDGVLTAPRAGDPCQAPDSPISEAPPERALLRALIAWTADGAAPPPSAYPTVAARTAVAPAEAFPSLTDLVVPDGLNAAPEKLHLTSAGHVNPIAATTYRDALPVIREGALYTLLVPKTDRNGNEIAGIRLPDVAVPLATYTGWNLRAAGHAIGEACLLSGGAIPLAVDRKQAGEKDSRATLDELYSGRADYQRKVAAAADALVKQGYLLKEDAESRYVAPSEHVSPKLIPAR